MITAKLVMYIFMKFKHLQCLAKMKPQKRKKIKNLQTFHP